MSDQTTEAAKALALDVVKLLVDRFGGDALLDVINIIDGKSTDQTLLDITILARGFVTAITGVVEPEAVRAMIQAGYAAADAAGDAALAAKFGPVK